MPLQPNFIERRLVNRGSIPGVLLDGMAAFQAEAALAAMELGVFDELREQPLDIETLAERVDAAPHGIEVLLRTLEPSGYVTQEGDLYRLTSAADEWLPDENMGMIATFFKAELRMGLDANEAIREAPEDGIFGWEKVQSGELGEAYQETMRWMAEDLLDPVVDAVALPDGAERMLDVGGSHGLYTVRFCEEYPNLKGSVLDWEIGLDSARRTLEERPEMADRIDLVERDFIEDELPQGYDFAFLGQIVHGFSPEENQMLFDKLAHATTERGTIAILDQVSDPPSTGKLPIDPFDSQLSAGIGATIGFILFLFTGGRSYEYDRLAGWLSDAGFSEVSYEPLGQSPGMSLVIARKTG
jgi:predicted O-methyltransferase YrrM